MKKEDILAKSREENEGKTDERELKILSDASKVGMCIGLIVSYIMVMISKIFDVPVLGLSAWSVCFSMGAGREIYQFIKMKNKGDLVKAIIETAVALACFVGMMVILVQGK